MNTLITGASGFLGRHLCRELLAAGHELTLLSRQSSTAAWWPDAPSSVRHLQADIGQVRAEHLAPYAAPHCVVHLAWQGLPHYHSLHHLEENLWNSYFFLKEMLKAGAKQLVVAGTCLEYGMQSGPLSESLPPHPTLAYALAKDTLRRMLYLLHREFDFSLLWLRFFYLYGPGQAPHSLLAQLDAALATGATSFRMSGGEQLRDFVPVQEAAQLAARLIAQSPIDAVVNIGSGKPQSVRRFVEQYLATQGRQLNLELGHYPYPDYEPMAFWADTTHLNALLTP